MAVPVLPNHWFDSLAEHQQLRLQQQQWLEPTASLARYALQGGKFLRPQLFFTILASFDSHSVWSTSLYDVALSVEWVHAYSLIHDDLPCMDNDDFRRGRPTLHRLSSDAQALLVGDALLTASFGLIAKAGGLCDRTKLALVQELSLAAGGSQLIGGQVRDLGANFKSSIAEILQTHVLKTGALFGAVAVMAAHCVSSKNLIPQIAEFRKWGRDFGILYQMIDDHLDGDGVSLLIPAATLRGEITNRMESLGDRSRAQGWDATSILARFDSLMWNS